MTDPIKVLLIDDDEEDFLLTKRIINKIPKRNYYLEWIGNYHTAEKVIAEQRHDIYLVDYYLGAFNGLDLIKGALNSGSNKPFILLTGQGDMEVDEKAMQVGASDYLIKGTITPDYLERSIRYNIQQARNLEEIKKLNSQLEDRVQARTNELAEVVARLESEIKERKQAEEALRESQNLYITIAKNFPKGLISVVNKDMECVFLDGTELTELGISREELIGKKFVRNFSDEDGEDLEGQIKKVFNGENISIETKFKGRYYLFNAVPLTYLGRKINQGLIVIKNITERKKAEREIMNALNKERDLNELKSRFVTLASHEFRTPLSTVLSSASLISKYPAAEDDEKRQKHVKRIKSSVTNLTGILNDFLSLSKLEEGETQAKPEKFIFEHFIAEILEEMQSVAKENQKIVFHNENVFGDAFLDKQILKNILINLLSNAIKYSSEGKEIKFDTLQKNKQLIIKVKDQGIGIPEADQQYIFSRFFRAKNAVNAEGTGLGLNIVKKYVDMLDGTIDFTSELNRGTTFTVKIPFEARINSNE